MTTIRVFVQTPVDGGTAPADGDLRWQPTERRVVPAAGLLPAAVVLPAAFTATLVAGAVDVEVEPSTGVWVWSVTEYFIGAPARRRYLSVPDVASVDYADLIEVDPATLTPAPSLEPAWAAPIADLEARLTTAGLTPDPDDPGFFLIGA